MLKCLSVVAVACLLVPSACAEDKPDYAKLIVGKWEVAKSDPGTVPEGAIFELTKDGKFKATLKDNSESVEGTYTLVGDKLNAKIGEMEQMVTIVKISDTEMNIKDKDDKEVTFKRKK